MRNFCVVFRDYFSSGLVLFSFSMPRNKSIDDVDNDDPSTNHERNVDDPTSTLVFISAHALGSLGFAVSIIAIWFGWLLPASVSATILSGESEIKIPPPKLKPKPRLPSRHSRRSTVDAGRAAVPLPTPIRRSSAPVNLTPILVPHHEDVLPPNSRRVYFTDSLPNPIVRRNTMPEQKSDRVEQLISQAIPSTSNGQPSSTATLPQIPASLNGSEEIPQAALDSDSSPHSSKASLLKPTSRFQKLKLGFQSKSHRTEPLERQSDQASITSTETTVSEPGKRASGGFVASWSLSRNRTAPDVTAADTASPSPSRLSFARRMSPSRATPPTPTSASYTEVLSPSFLSRKSQKRVSAPIPRTSPYGAPYFATPPLVVNNNYPAYLKGLPQFEDEIRSSPQHASDGEDAEGPRGRTSSIRRVALNSAPRTATKRRSASEDWNQRLESKS